jgi:cytochrome c biogenesis protein CcdA
MKMKISKVFVWVLAFLAPLTLAGQGTSSVQMADTFRQEGKIYVVVLGLVIILTGVILFLIRVDRKVFKLEKRFEKK